MEAIIFYLILSICVGAWARKWDKGFWFYFIISAILSPLIGAIILLIRGKGNQIECPQCGEEIKKIAKICKHCGAQQGQSYKDRQKIA